VPGVAQDADDQVVHGGQEPGRAAGADPAGVFAVRGVAVVQAVLARSQCWSANGSGKSNFLDALAFLARAVETTANQAIEEHDGLNAIHAHRSERTGASGSDQPEPGPARPRRPGCLNRQAILHVSMENGLTAIGDVDDASQRIVRDKLCILGELMRSNQISPSSDSARPRT
jgi:hypothetical protein